MVTSAPTHSLLASKFRSTVSTALRKKERENEKCKLKIED
jgi:hypothetical protein